MQNRKLRGFTITLSKEGIARFLSGTDTMRVLLRSIARAGFFTRHTQGYVKRPGISAGPPAPLGVESRAEMFYLELDADDPETLSQRLRRALPEGFAVLSCEESEKPRWREITGVVYELPEGMIPKKPVDGLVISGRKLIHRIGSGSFPALFSEAFGPEADISRLVKEGYVWARLSDCPPP
jgi:hypothetical protein